MPGGQLFQLDNPDARNGIFLGHQLIAVGGGGADVWLGVELIPRPQLGGCCVFSCCFVDFGLSPAPYILDDPLVGLVVVFSGVPPSAAILTFSDVPFAVDSLFCHEISSFEVAQNIPEAERG